MLGKLNCRWFRAVFAKPRAEDSTEASSVYVSVVNAVSTLVLAMLQLSFSMHASKLLTDIYYS